MLADSIFDGPITNLLCILIESLSCVHAKGRKRVNDFKFDTFIGRVQSDGAGSMAVKGLRADRTGDGWDLCSH